MSTLIKAAKDAARSAAQLKNTGIDPAVHLPGFLQPLRDLGAALASASSSAWHLALMAADVIPEPGLADSAEKMLRDASARADAASNRIDGASDEIRRILRRAGTELPYLDGYPDSRLGKAARTAFADFAHLSSVAERAVRASPAPPLLAVSLATQQQADALASLAGICERLRPAVFEGYDRLPRGLNLKAGRATGQVHQAAGTLKKAGTAAHRAASGPMQDALRQERKRAATQ